MFSFNQNKDIVIKTKYILNGGIWNHIQLDYSKGQMRIIFNEIIRFIDLEKEDEYEIFNGDLYIGGLPNE